MKQGLSWILISLIGLTGCNDLPWSGSQSQQERLPDRWQTYRNERYGFEFLHPEGWIDSIPPEAQDGIAFSDPRNPGIEIRGWAELKRSTDKKSQNPKPNFTTDQGVPARLDIAVENQSSVMTLTIIQKDVEYHWRATAPTVQFGNYYRFFDFIAKRYRVSQ